MESNNLIKHLETSDMPRGKSTQKFSFKNVIILIGKTYFFVSGSESYSLRAFSPTDRIIFKTLSS